MIFTTWSKSQVKVSCITFAELSIIESTALNITIFEAGGCPYAAPIRAQCKSHYNNSFWRANFWNLLILELAIHNSIAIISKFGLQERQNFNTVMLSHFCQAWLIQKFKLTMQHWNGLFTYTSNFKTLQGWIAANL